MAFLAVRRGISVASRLPTFSACNFQIYACFIASMRTKLVARYRWVHNAGHYNSLLRFSNESKIFIFRLNISYFIAPFCFYVLSE